MMKVFLKSLLTRASFMRARVVSALSHVRGWYRATRFILGSRRRPRALSADAARRRLLAIWDFSAQPYSVGDIVLLHEVALSKCHELELDGIDFALLAEPETPCRESFRRLGVDAVNHIDHLSALIPVFLIGDRVSGLHIFNSRDDLESFIGKHSDTYSLWPDPYRYAAKTDLNYASFHRMSQFFRDHGFIPTLSFRQALVDWGHGFFARVAGGRSAIVVQIRNAGEYNPGRNSSLDAWLELFEWCSERFPVVFIIVCSREEVDDRLRKLDNVVVAKDHDTTLDQDLALVYCAPAFMGVPSGPCTVAYFRDQPYSILNAIVSDVLSCVDRHPWGYSWNHARPNQRLIPCERETKDILIEEFRILYEAIEAPTAARDEAPRPRLGSQLKFGDDRSSRYYA